MGEILLYVTIGALIVLTISIFLRMTNKIPMHSFSAFLFFGSIIGIAIIFIKGLEYGNNYGLYILILIFFSSIFGSLLTTVFVKEY